MNDKYVLYLPTLTASALFSVLRSKVLTFNVFSCFENFCPITAPTDKFKKFVSELSLKQTKEYRAFI